MKCINYSFLVDGYPIYVPGNDKYVAYDMDYEFTAGEAGRFSFTIPPTNPNRDKIKLRIAEIEIRRGTDAIWHGFAVKKTKNLYNEITYDCEGVLSYLNDSQYLSARFYGTPEEFLRAVVDNHNNQMGDFMRKKFSVGAVTVSGQVEAENDNPKPSLEFLKEHLTDKLGGYLVIGQALDGTLEISYLKDPSVLSDQKIEFGKNLIDISDLIDTTEVYTVLFPRGKKDDNGNRITISSVSEDGLYYLQDNEKVNQFSRIVRTKTWDDIEDPLELLAVAMVDYANTTTIPTTITANAVDLSEAGIDVGAFKLYDSIPVISSFNNIQTVLFCSKISGKLNEPESTTYTLGTTIPNLTDRSPAHVIG